MPVNSGCDAAHTLSQVCANLRIALSQSLADLPVGMSSRADLPVSPLLKMRRWFRVSWQYAAEYRKGVACSDAVKSVSGMRFRYHRDLSQNSRARQAEAVMEQAALGV